MWCIPPEQSAAFVSHMEDGLDVYQRPADPRRPLVCLDETSLQLIGEARAPRPVQRGRPARYDSEDVRHGTCNLFIVFDPLAGQRVVKVTERRCRSCTPTRDTIIAVAGASAEPAASRPGSLGAASRAANGSAATAGSSSERWPGWPASAASPSVTRGAPTSTSPSPRSLALSSAKLRQNGFVSDSKGGPLR
jgi:hypothetical protein